MKRMMFGTSLAMVAVLTTSPAQADQIPDKVAAMIQAAADTGNAATLKTVADLAKKTNPQSAAEIDAMVASIQNKVEAKRLAKLRSQSFFEGWKGHGQAGGSIATGNTSSKGLSLGLDLTKNGIHWRHTINATFDYARQNGQTAQKRYFASYEANYKFSDRFYALGLVSWENNRFAGFNRRFSENIGLGYSVIKQPDMTLDLEGGPALRQTNYITGESQNELAGRAAVDYSWKIAPGITFGENATYYAQAHDSTLTSTTALTMKLNGALSLQTSFLINHETNPPIDLEKTNTLSRLTLVYGF
ncbi:hypothetical protein GCM10023219_12290 [Stakelama sediminis]|uniref:Putative salt-induced outer membrane protein n=2 Tax=Stakelama sediminis TaxID=463200 RepID=A0A840YWN7_9SPHN|nr:putative salt-induced outer membrane protein [Stakelama sediminis]